MVGFVRRRSRGLADLVGRRTGDSKSRKIYLGFYGIRFPAGDEDGPRGVKFVEIHGLEISDTPQALLRLRAWSEMSGTGQIGCHQTFLLDGVDGLWDEWEETSPGKWKEENLGHSQSTNSEQGANFKESKLSR
jgi:hypothetical protein